MQKQLPKNTKLVVFQGENDERLAVWGIEELDALINKIRDDEQKHALYIAKNFIINKQIGSPMCNVVAENSYKVLLKKKSLSK